MRTVKPGARAEVVEVWVVGWSLGAVEAAGDGGAEAVVGPGRTVVPRSPAWLRGMNSTA